MRNGIPYGFSMVPESTVFKSLTEFSDISNSNYYLKTFFMSFFLRWLTVSSNLRKNYVGGVSIASRRMISRKHSNLRKNYVGGVSRATMPTEIAKEILRVEGIGVVTQMISPHFQLESGCRIGKIKTDLGKFRFITGEKSLEIGTRYHVKGHLDKTSKDGEILQIESATEV